MNLPFTTDQFLAVFERYNQTMWPLQIILFLLAVAVLLFSYRRSALSDKIIAGILAFLWLWLGVAYHLLFFSEINPGAYLFGAVNILQGLLFLYFGVLRSRLAFGDHGGISGITGWIFIVYALVVYPLIGEFLGHVFPKSPTFGLPCPTTIFTFGVLLWTRERIPKAILVVPFLWSLVGFSAALTLGIREDTGLLVAGLLGSLLILVRDRKPAKTMPGVERVA